MSDPGPESGNVLVIEDDMDCGATLVQILRMEGYGVRWVQTRDAAVVALKNYLYDHIVLDVAMPGMGIDTFARKFVQNRHNVILISAVVNPATEASRLGIKHALRKPFDPVELVEMLRGMSSPCK